MRNNLLFKWCKCSEYLSKVSDGCCIGKDEVEGISAEVTALMRGEIDGEQSPFVRYPSKYEKDRKPFYSPCEGANDVRKWYYERKKRKFSGVIVGFKDVVAEGFLGVDTDYDPYRGERYRVFKSPAVVLKCAIVYYANNKKRYVPLDAICMGKEVICVEDKM